MKGVLASLAPRCDRSSTSRTTWRRTTWRARGSRSRATGGASRKARCISSSSIRASAARAARWRRRARGDSSSGRTTACCRPRCCTRGARCVSLRDPAGAAPTFHGRDVFAPAAAQLALGASLETLGDVAERSGDPPNAGGNAARRRRGAGRGDHRGPVRQRGDEPARDARRAGAGERSERSRCGGRTPTRRRGRRSALVGSSGLVEIAVRDGSAAERLGLSGGAGSCCYRGPELQLRVAGSE